MSSTYFEPVPELDYDLMPSGEFCRYKLEGNELIIENYEFHLRLFKLLHAAVSEDSIRFTYYKLKTLAGAKDKIEDEVYLRTKADLTTRVLFPE